jgi:2-dehydropantoate 2-reductase
MNIGVIGIGGVGGYFGGKLTQLESDHNLNIFFIARGEHLKEIKNHGLILDTEDEEMICKPTLTTDNIKELPILDFCLLCVKSYDLDNILIPLNEKISQNTIILPLLNGIDIYERIRKRIKSGIILPSCVYVGTHIERPGKVVQRGGTCMIIFGKDPQNDNFDPKIFDLFNDANIKYKWVDDPYIEIWSKFIFIASFGLVTASLNKSIGEVLSSEELSENVKNIMNEIVNIAIKKGINLPSTIINDSYEKGKKFPPETKTSFQRDFEITDKPDERDIFGGVIIRLGKELNVATDMTNKIYDIIEKKKKLNI